MFVYNIEQYEYLKLKQLNFIFYYTIQVIHAYRGKRTIHTSYLTIGSSIVFISFMFIYNTHDVMGALQTVNIYIGSDLYSSATSLTTHAHTHTQTLLKENN